jgi:hypothetical protein
MREGERGGKGERGGMQEEGRERRDAGGREKGEDGD